MVVAAGSVQATAQYSRILGHRQWVVLQGRLLVWHTPHSPPTPLRSPPFPSPPPRPVLLPAPPAAATAPPATLPGTTCAAAPSTTPSTAPARFTARTARTCRTTSPMTSWATPSSWRCGNAPNNKCCMTYTATWSLRQLPALLHGLRRDVPALPPPPRSGSWFKGRLEGGGCATLHSFRVGRADTSGCLGGHFRPRHDLRPRYPRFLHTRLPCLCVGTTDPPWPTAWLTPVCPAAPTLACCVIIPRRTVWRRATSSRATWAC